MTRDKACVCSVQVWVIFPPNIFHLKLAESTDVEQRLQKADHVIMKMTLKGICQG